MKKLLLLTLVFLSALSASAGNTLLYKSSDGKIVTPYNTDAFGAAIVSNTYENGIGKLVFDNEVTTIGDRAFQECTTLASIEIPNSVTEIQGAAFRDCTSLAEVEIPTSVTKLAPYAFDRCSSLSKVTFNAINCEDLRLGSESPFNECPNLTEVVIGDKVTRMQEGLFSRANISKIEIPASVKDIGQSAFSQCQNLESIVIPEGVERIGDGAFSYCSALKKVEFNAINCEIYTLGYYGNTTIFGVFNGCDALESFVFSDKVKRFPELHFNPGDGYVIELPAHFTSFDPGAYYGCGKIAVIRPQSAVPPTIDYNSFSGLDIKKCAVQLPEEMQEAYRTAPVWSEMLIMGIEELEAVVDGDKYSITSFPAKTCALLEPKAKPVGELQIPASVNIRGTEYAVTSIENNAFKDCDQLTKVVLPAKFEILGKSAFQGCTALKDINLPEGFIKLGDYALANTAIEEITIPENMEIIGSGCFDNTNLTTFYYNATYALVYSPLFMSCPQLTDAYIGKNVKNLRGMFQDSKVKNVHIPSDGALEFLYYSDFEGCELNELHLPDSLQQIYYHALKDAKIGTLTLPKGLKEFASHSVPNCSVKNLRYFAPNCTFGDWAWSPEDTWRYNDLETLYIGKEVAELPNFIYKFLDSEALRSIEIEAGNPSYASEHGILYNADKTELLYYPVNNTNEEFYSPDNMTIIPAEICNGNTHLKKVVLRNVTNVGESAFKNCSNLETLILGENVQSLGHGAFNLGRASSTKNFTTVISLNTIPPTMDTSFYFTNTKKYTTLYVPAAALETYQNDANWSQFKEIVPLTDEEIETLGIDGVTTDSPTTANTKAYNLQGQPVDENYRGIVIKDGKKILRK